VNCQAQPSRRYYSVLALDAVEELYEAATRSPRLSAGSKIVGLMVTDGNGKGVAAAYLVRVLWLVTLVMACCSVSGLGSWTSERSNSGWYCGEIKFRGESSVRF